MAPNVCRAALLACAATMALVSAVASQPIQRTAPDIRSAPLYASLQGLEFLAIEFITKRKQHPLDVLHSSNHTVAAARAECFESTPAAEAGQLPGGSFLHKHRIDLASYLEADVAATVRAKVAASVHFFRNTEYRTVNPTYLEVPGRVAMTILKRNPSAECLGRSELVVGTVYMFSGQVVETASLQIWGKLDADASLAVTAALKKLTSLFPKLNLPSLDLGGSVDATYNDLSRSETEVSNSISLGFSPLKVSRSDVREKLSLNSRINLIQNLEKALSLYKNIKERRIEITTGYADCKYHSTYNVLENLSRSYDSMGSGDEKDLEHFDIGNEEHKMYAKMLNLMRIVDQACRMT